jgi:hypothetical protein
LKKVPFSPALLDGKNTSGSSLGRTFVSSDCLCSNCCTFPSGTRGFIADPLIMEADEAVIQSMANASDGRGAVTREFEPAPVSRDDAYDKFYSSGDSLICSKSGRGFFETG